MRFLVGKLVTGLALGAIGAGWTVGCSGSEAPASNTEDASTSTWNPESDDAEAPSKSDPGSTSKDAGFDASPQRFCLNLAPPAGVADFFCADFDGANPREGFTSWTVPGGGALTQTIDSFYSPPSALVTSNNATLYWEKAGAKPFSEVDLKFALNVGTINPPPTKAGNVTIIELGAGSTKTSIRYARGATVAKTANYIGYYLESGAVQAKIPTAPETDTWTQVHLIWSKNGVIELYYNDDPIYTTTGPSVSSPTVFLTVGLVANGDAPEIAQHAFDDVVVAVKRD